MGSKEHLVLGLCSERCLGKFIGGDIVNKECLAQVATNGLNLGIIMGAGLVHAPQIIKIYRAKSVKGLSEATYLVQVLSNSLAIAYNSLRGFSFRNWGEIALINLQFYAILGLYWRYSSLDCGTAEQRVMDGPSGFRRRSTLCLVYTIFFAYLLSGAVPEPVVPLLGLAPVPFILLGRMPQIVLNYRQQHTGQLSAISSALLVCGNIARVFTTLFQVQDVVMLTGHVAALVFNAIPLLQIILYWSRTTKVLAQEQAEELKKANRQTPGLS